MNTSQDKDFSNLDDEGDFFAKPDRAKVRAALQRIEALLVENYLIKPWDHSLDPEQRFLYWEKGLNVKRQNDAYCLQLGLDIYFENHGIMLSYTEAELIQRMMFKNHPEASGLWSMNSGHSVTLPYTVPAVAPAA